ncbi:MAG: tetratricopeptide repeat protein [Nitrospinae bacterium]|nr:tetratricopeptide repeat protein [Nitrospinota bacterium]
MRRLLFLVLAVALTAGCFRATNLMHEAESLYLRNQYREAVRVFLQIVDRYPGSPEAETALLRVGQTFMLNLADPQNALEYFGRLVSEYPNGEKAVQAHELMAQIYERTLRDYDHAVEQYRILLDMGAGPDPERYMLGIGRCFYLKEDYKQAIAEFRRLVDTRPSSPYVPEAEYQIANCYFVANKCDDAIKQYNRVLEKYPATKYKNDIFLSLGVCMEDKEDYTTALKYYRDLENTYENKALIKKRIDSVMTRMRDKHR